MVITPPKGWESPSNVTAFAAVPFTDQSLGWKVGVLVVLLAVPFTGSLVVTTMVLTLTVFALAKVGTTLSMRTVFDVPSPVLNAPSWMSTTTLTLPEGRLPELKFETVPLMLPALAEQVIGASAGGVPWAGTMWRAHDV